MISSIAKPRPVHTLLGESTLQTSLTCLPTLTRYSADPIRLVIHEDGTLSEQGRDALREALPGAEFVARSRADEEVNDRLGHYPHCRTARATNIMFLKMFDMVLLEPGELAYCDSDILFLRPFTGLFGEQPTRFPALFMTDSRDAYAVRPWHLWPFGRLRLASRANAGLMRIAQGLLDLDAVEWLLRRMDGHRVWVRRWYWNEQTCWAALAGQVECGLWDSRQIVMASLDMAEFTTEAVAVHFVSTFRSHLAEYSQKTAAPDSSPVRVEARAARRVGPLAQMVSDLRGRLRFLGVGTR
jgi:hypothetical protein